jgi:hypothetical protein
LILKRWVGLCWESCRRGAQRRNRGTDHEWGLLTVRAGSLWEAAHSLPPPAQRGREFVFGVVIMMVSYLYRRCCAFGRTKAQRGGPERQIVTLLGSPNLFPAFGGGGDQ